LIDNNTIRLIFRSPLENGISIPELNLVGIVFAEWLANVDTNTQCVNAPATGTDPIH
jgi:hypothetical protein